MIDFRPYRGWRYNPQIVPDLSAVICPPYDVIDSKLHSRLMNRSPHNFVRLILNPESTPESHRPAVDIWRAWVDRDIVQKDSSPGFTIIEQSFSRDGKDYHRLGIIGLLRIESSGNNILPHERTINKHVKDRYNLLRDTHLNTGQIFMSYRDQEMVVERETQTLRESAPLASVSLDDETHLKIWSVKNNDTLQSLRKLFLRSRAIIADGHHRFQTALRFARDHTENPGAKSVMVTLVNSEQPGMLVLPIYRVIHSHSISAKEVKHNIPSIGTVESVATLDELNALVLNSPAEADIVSLGLSFMENQARHWLIKIPRDDRLLERCMPHLSRRSRRLDVNILHQFVLNDALGLDTNNSADLEKISIVKGTDRPSYLFQDRAEIKAVAMCRPPTLDQIFRVAKRGEYLPQKSTFFFPKIPSGLVVRSLSDG